MDSENVEDRTFFYCATYNNGVDENGEPDPSIVKRYSESPQNGLFGFSCTPGDPGISCLTYVTCSYGAATSDKNGYEFVIQTGLQRYLKLDASERL